jgi:hypothetical protein
MWELEAFTEHVRNLKKHTFYELERIKKSKIGRAPRVEPVFEPLKVVKILTYISRKT